MNELIRIHKPDIMGLVEPRIRGVQADSTCIKMSFHNWIRIEALGFSGGIWVLWKDCIQVNVLRTHLQFIHKQINSQG